MTTDNGAVATADTEVTQETQVQPEQPLSESEAITKPDAEPAAAAADEASGESAPAAADEDDGPITVDRYMAESGKAAAAAPSEKPKLPGITQVEYDRQQDAALEAWTNELLREQIDPQIRQAAEKAYEQLGEKPSAQQILEWVRPWIAHSKKLSGQSMFNRMSYLARQHLSEDELKPLLEDNRQFQNYGEIFEAAVKSARHAVEQDWKSKEGQTWVSKKDADDLAAKNWNKGYAKAEADFKSGTYQSGQSAQGRPRDTRSEDEILLDPNTPIEETRKILARRNGGQ